MKTMAICLALGAVMGLARCASAAELPARSVCNIISELAYDHAVELGADLPDGAYERAQADCEWDADFGAGVSLNELVAVDGEVWLPVCQFEGGCVQVSK